MKRKSVVPGQRYVRLIAVGVIAGLAGSNVVLGVTGDEVLTALQSRITLTKVNPWSRNIATPGTVLTVQKAGLVAADPKAFTKLIRIKNGDLVSSGGSTLFGGSSGHDLKPGDKVYLYDFSPRSGHEGFLVKVMTVATYDVVKRGSTSSQHGVSFIEFTFDGGLDAIDANTALAALSKWFKTDQEASEGRTVKLGQTPAEVEAILGSPDKRIDLGAKLVYVYKDMKVIFVNGHVSDVQ
jgi:hypothetical protein